MTLILPDLIMRNNIHSNSVKIYSNNICKHWTLHTYIKHIQVIKILQLNGHASEIFIKKYSLVLYLINTVKIFIKYPVLCYIHFNFIKKFKQILEIYFYIGSDKGRH